MSRPVPGLVDIHVHGVDGLDVMRGDGDLVVARLRSLGVEWCCPTTVSAPPEQIQQALRGIHPESPGFAGVHLEGPFLNPQKAGAQPAEALSKPSVDAYLALVGEFEPLIRIVTLAPELEGSADLIAYLRTRNVLVSAGHTDATYDALEAAKPDHLTHFYNRMSPLSHREAGAVGYGLLSGVRCELIYDRAHVGREAAEILLRSKGQGEILGISDGTAASGKPDGWTGTMWGHGVTKSEGCVRLVDGTLAGSAATLADVFRNLWQDFGPETAIEACSEAPRSALGLPEPRMHLLVEDDGTIIEVRQ